MSAALALVEPAVPDQMALARAVKRMRRSGFEIRVAGDSLQVSPIESLSDSQRAYLRARKPALVALLMDAEILAAALVSAGPAGLGWREGTPTGWNDARLLAADEVLYGDGRMVNVLDRRYARQHAPAPPPFVEYLTPVESPQNASAANVTPLDREAYEERAAIMEYDGGLPRDEAERKALALAMRAAELQSQGWDSWNAKARAESEALPGWEARP